jgi:L-histidine Nalpha-methyltransferase
MATSEATETQQQDVPGGGGGFREDVLRGLGSDPKWLPTRFLYDRQGREFFEMISRRPEYYPREAEDEIYGYFAGEIAQSLGSGAVLIQWGPASKASVCALLDGMQDPAGYVGVGASAEMMQPVVDAVAERYPALRPVFIPTSEPVLGELPENVRSLSDTRIVFCPGGEVGNSEADVAQELLRSFHRAVGEGGKILVGVDLEKTREVVEAAYKDKAQILDRLHLNLLQRVNRELGADFDLMKFRFEIAFDPDRKCIEMFVVSMASQNVSLAGQTFELANNERIRTQVSYQYSPESFQALAHEAGASATQVWMDSGRRFAAYLLECS